MMDYFKLDAQTFADWDVDFIKIDGCYADIELMVDGKTWCYRSFPILAPNEPNSIFSVERLHQVW